MENNNDLFFLPRFIFSIIVHHFIVIPTHLLRAEGLCSISIKAVDNDFVRDALMGYPRFEIQKKEKYGYN